MNNKQADKQVKQPQYLIMLAIAAGALAIFLLVKLLTGVSNDVKNTRGETVTDADILIPLNEITENAAFYPAVVNGTDLEVIAIKAPDGTVRTAFNTCQVCYLSGKGYYTQKGDQLVCENCGNRFSMDDVGVVHSGCNPIPITDSNRTVSDTGITIPLETLTEATTMFKNWKR